MLTLALLLTTPVIKTGTCPLGWYTSGNYCVSRPTGSTKAPKAIQRAGTCPLGWYTQSSYCVSR